MGKASQENIDALLAAVHAHFPDADLLSRLSEPGAIDDVNELMLATLTQTLRDLPARQASVIAAYRAAAERLASLGRAPVAIDGPRLALASSLRKALAAYHVDPVLAASLLDPAVLAHYDDLQLAAIRDSFEKLRDFQRNLLQALLDADDGAEARARDRATKVTALDVRVEDVQKAALAIQERMTRGDSERDARLASAAARHEEEIRSTLDSAAVLHESVPPSRA